MINWTLWCQGPPWLRLNPPEWPALVTPSSESRDLEIRNPVAHTTQVDEPWELTRRFSSWAKLIRVTAYIFRFIARCRHPSKSSTNGLASSRALSYEECQTARVFWLRWVQAATFAKELAALRKGQALFSKNMISSLRPFLDSEHLIRVGGRLAKSALSFEKKHFVLLAPHPLVQLIARHAHVRSLHAGLHGLQLTLATLRQDYWLLRARSIVKQIIFQCLPCIPERAQVPQQLMGHLPQARISAPARPFLHCGVDYAGPMLTRASAGCGITSRKACIALFVCLASRAIHLELVSSYSTPAFLDAFSRFCARRGMP